MSQLISKYSQNKQASNLEIERGEYNDVFEKLYSSENQKNILLYYGIGGIGKTRILKNLQEEYKEKDYVFYYDFDKDVNPIKYYESIMTQAKKHGLTFIYFPLIFTIYWKKENPNIEFKETKIPYFEEGTFFGDILESIIHDTHLELVGGGLNILNKVYKLVQKKFTFSNEDKEMFSDLIAEDDPQKIVDNFPYCLAKDFQLIKSKKQNNAKFIFFMDTYEKLFTTRYDDNDKWIRELIKDLNLVIKSESIFALAGRNKLNREIGSDSKQLDVVEKEVTELSTPDFQKLMKKHNINDKAFIEKVEEISKGVVYYVNLAIQIYNKSEDKNKIDFNSLTSNDDLFKLFTHNFPNDELTIIENLSNLNFFTLELFEFILQKYKIHCPKSKFNDLMAYSFIKQEDDRYSIHDLMRESILSKLKSEKKYEIHEDMAVWYQEKIEVNSKKTRASDDILFKEYAYHLINSTSNPDIVIKNYEKYIAKNLKFSGLHNVHINILEYILPITFQDKLNHYFLIQLGMLYLEVKKNSALEKVIEKLKNLDLSPEELSYLNYIIAHAYAHTKKPSTTYYDKALKNSNINVRILVNIGKSNIFKRLKKFEEAKKVIFEAIELAKGNDDMLSLARAYDKLHLIYDKEKDFDNAYDYLLKSLDIKFELLDAKHILLANGLRNASNFLLKHKSTGYQEQLNVTLAALRVYHNYYKSSSQSITSLYENLVKLLRRYSKKEVFLDNLPAYIDKDILYLKLYIGNMIDLDMLLTKVDTQNKVDILFMLAQHNNSKKRYNDEQDILNLAINSTTTTYEKSNLYFRIAQYKKNEKKLYFYEKYFKLTNPEPNYKNMFRAYLDLFRYFKGLDDIKNMKLYLNKQESIINRADLNSFENQLAVLESKLLLKSNNEKKIILQDMVDLALKYNNLIALKKIFKNIIFECTSSDEKIKYLKEQLQTYQELKLDISVDMTYANIAKIYLEKHEYKKVILYYDKQIKIREKAHNFAKLSDAYYFKATLYQKYPNDLSNSEELYAEHLKKSHEYILKTDDTSAKIKNCNSLIQYFKQKNDKEMYLIFVDKKFKFAEETNNPNSIVNAYNEYINFYEYFNDFDNVENYLDKKLSLLFEHKKFYLKEYCIALEEVKKFKLNHNKDAKKILLELLENKILQKVPINDIICEVNKYIQEDDIIQFFNKFIAILFSEQNNTVTNYAISCYFDYNINYLRKTDFFNFMDKQVNKIKKLELTDRLAFFNYLIRNDDKSLNRFFYEHYLDAVLEKNSKDFNKTNNILQNAMNYYSQKDKILYSKYLKLQNAQKRKNNAYLVDGEVIKKWEKTLGENIEPLKEYTFNNVLSKFNEIFTYFENYDGFQEKLLDEGLSISILEKAISPILRNFNELEYGFDKLYDFLNFSLQTTNLKIVEELKNNYTYTKIVYKSNNKFSDVKPIDNLETHIHTINSYTNLTSKMFHEGDGVFVTKNKQLFIQTIKELINIFKEDQFLSMEDITINLQNSLNNFDQVIVQNILYSLQYAKIFQVQNILRDLNDRKVLLKIKNTKEILEQLKEYGWKRLKSIKNVKNFDYALYEKIWLNFSMLL